MSCSILINYTRKEVFGFPHAAIRKGDDKFNMDSGYTALHHCIDEFEWSDTDIIQMSDCRYTSIYLLVYGRWIDQMGYDMVE